MPRTSAQRDRLQQDPPGWARRLLRQIESHQCAASAIERSIVLWGCRYEAKRSVDAQLDRAEILYLEQHEVASRYVLGSDDATGYHYIAAQQAAADRGEVIGEPGDRVERMAHGVGAAALADLVAVDGGDATDRSKIDPFPVFDGRTEYSAFVPAVVGD